MSLIFLSHIHEEKELALIIQQAIEEEFSGFVTVFVSSDGKTIPAGSNFLRRIEKGLVECVGAIYLISPVSVKRNWINFELGAVWIRNHVNELNQGVEIPVIPICHSGIRPSELPMPLTNLNSVISTDSIHLKSVFESIQTAVGGRGKLKTDFEELSKSIYMFEQKYTIGKNVVKMFDCFGLNSDERAELVKYCLENSEKDIIYLKKIFLEEKKFNILSELKEQIFKEEFDVADMSGNITFLSGLTTTKGYDVIISINPKFIIKHQETILSF